MLRNDVLVFKFEICNHLKSGWDSKQVKEKKLANLSHDSITWWTSQCDKWDDKRHLVTPTKHYKWTGVPNIVSSRFIKKNFFFGCSFTLFRNQEGPHPMWRWGRKASTPRRTAWTVAPACQDWWCTPALRWDCSCPPRSTQSAAAGQRGREKRNLKKTTTQNRKRLCVRWERRCTWM